MAEGRSKELQLNVSVLMLERPGKPPEKSWIAFDDPDVHFRNFHKKEKEGYRWTGKESELGGFVFPTGGQRIVLIVSVFPFSIYPAQEVSLRLTVNGQHPAQLLEIVADREFHFLMDCSSIPAITSVTLNAKAFVRKEQGISSDSGQLGIAFRDIRFEEERSIPSH